jgi:heme-degrading monooxygenase HmoA
MFVRQGSFEVLPGKLDALRETYARAGMPIIRAAPGNLDVYLLEPADGADTVIACTIWQTEEHARAYEASGTAQQVIAKVKGFFAGPPTLRSYHLVRGAVSPFDLTPR